MRVRLVGGPGLSSPSIVFLQHHLTPDKTMEGPGCVEDLNIFCLETSLMNVYKTYMMIKFMSEYE